MPRRKICMQMLGRCDHCGTEFVRPAECTHTVCECLGNPHAVALSPVVILRDPVLTRFQEIADSLGVSLEKLINSVLEVGCNMVQKGKITLRGGSK